MMTSHTTQEFLLEGYAMLMRPNKAKQLFMAATAWVVWLCACVRYWPDRGLVFECGTCFYCCSIASLVWKPAHLEVLAVSDIKLRYLVIFREFKYQKIKSACITFLLVQFRKSGD